MTGRYRVPESWRLALHRYRKAAARRLSRVGTRLALAFLAVAALIPVVGVIAIRELHDTSLRAARIEAQHVAEQIAFTMAQREEPNRVTPLYATPEALQAYVESLNRDLGRDIEVVGVDRVIIADAIPANRGKVFTEDQGQVAATMADGTPRTFEERNADFPEGIQLIVVPLYSPGHIVVGAVILEYTPILQELLDATRPTRNIIIAASAGGAVVALLLSYLLAHGFVRDLRRLSRAADLIASGDDTARAHIESRSEVGDLAIRFNTMAERIGEQKAILLEMTVSDPLTGLHNRRSFQSRLEDVLAQARRSGAPLAMLMLDLDHFKAINDRYGHPAGDEALRAVAHVMESALRTEDVAARLGGEEFGVLLPGTGQRAARDTAEQLRSAIVAHPAHYADSDLIVTASIGVVSYPEHGETLDTLMWSADQALYAAKRAGRNRVSGPPPPESTTESS